MPAASVSKIERDADFVTRSIKGVEYFASLNLENPPVWFDKQFQMDECFVKGLGSKNLPWLFPFESSVLYTKKKGCEPPNWRIKLKKDIVLPPQNLIFKDSKFGQHVPNISNS